MLFNSVEFLFIYLPLVLAVFSWLNRRKDGQWAVAFLAAASIFFYAWWDSRYVVLLLGSMICNWWFGTRLMKSPSRKLLATAISVNLLVLGYYKYANFFVKNAMALVGSDFTLHQIVLPLGISFFTFTQIAFLVDAYKGLVKEKGPLNYALFVTFFPHLIAGPVLHHKEMMPQFAALQGKKPDSLMVANGLFLLILGLFKKLLIADTLAQYVDPAFANVSTMEILDAWTATVGYSLQLYFDFSAYSEMAMGISMLFGVMLPMNFNSPYRATNIADFWKRWHMTLSRFLRDYLYIPLGGNRKGIPRMFAALWITMLLGGIWHGAGWQFIVWGVMHGTLLIVHRLWTRAGLSMPDWPARLLTFSYVMLAWVMFRANSVSDALIVWKKMAGLDGIVLPAAFREFKLHGIQTALSPTINGIEIFVMLAMVVFCMTNKNVHEIWQKWSLSPKRRYAGAVIGLGLVSFFNLSRVSSWVYFQF
jgi:D-alanyl-lipoteichoic acid acyltransferase DltB (MBOAT superfamily)